MLKHSLGLGLGCVVLTFALSARFTAPVGHTEEKQLTDAELAQKAFAILEKNCANCHGEGKRNVKQGAIYKDSWKILVEQQKKVVPKKPEASTAYTRMLDEDDPMPPKKQKTPRPSKEDIELVRLWIEKGAPNWKQ
jgi:mono/diheme cytochrome c family protein